MVAVVVGEVDIKSLDASLLQKCQYIAPFARQVGVDQQVRVAGAEEGGVAKVAVRGRDDFEGHGAGGVGGGWGQY